MADEVTEKIIGAAIEVHRILGPGLLESVYESALCHEMELRKCSGTARDLSLLIKARASLYATYTALLLGAHAR